MISRFSLSKCINFKNKQAFGIRAAHLVKLNIHFQTSVSLESTDKQSRAESLPLSEIMENSSKWVLQTEAVNCQYRFRFEKCVFGVGGLDLLVKLCGEKLAMPFCGAFREKTKNSEFSMEGEVCLALQSI